MAGGTGTRLRPLTCDLPKPMVPILGRPVMEHIIRHLVRCGFSQAAVTTAYLAEKIQKRFGDGAEYSIDLKYFHEKTPLGTGGSVRNTGDFTNETFAVISGDALTDLDLAAAIKFHQQKGALVTLVLHRQAVPLEYGVVITDEDGKILRFLEKPAWSQVFSDTVNTGIYILEPEALKDYTPGEEFDFSKDLFPRLLKAGAPMYGYVADCYWCDIGDLRTYRQAQFDMLAQKTGLPLPGKQHAPGVWLDEGAEIADCHILGPTYIGANTLISQGVRLESANIIGANCSLAPLVSLKQTVVWDNTSLGRGVEGRGATICSGVSIGDQVSLFEGAVIGSGSNIGDRAVVKPEARIWPEKQVETGSQIDGALVWGTKYKTRIFGNRGVEGRIEIDLTPEAAVRLGLAHAALTPGLTLIARDHSLASRVLADALGAGTRAAGSRVITLETSALPLVRFTGKHYKASSSVFIQTDETGRIHLEFMDQFGAPLAKNSIRKLENNLVTQDLPRRPAEMVGKITYSADLTSDFFAETVPHRRNGKMNFSIVMASADARLAALAGAYLESLGCRVFLDQGNGTGFSKILTARGADAGFVLNAGGENLTVYDNRGQALSPEDYHALATRIVAERDSDRIIIPLDQPDVPGIPEDRIQKTSQDPSAVIAAHLAGTVLQYILRYDAVRAPGLLLDWLMDSDRDLASVVDELPGIYFQRRQIECPWQQKGRVLKELASEYPGQNTEGVRVTDGKGWALILPDSSHPHINIFAQGHNEEYAQEIGDNLDLKIKGILSSELENENG